MWRALVSVVGRGAGTLAAHACASWCGMLWEGAAAQVVLVDAALEALVLSKSVVPERLARTR